MKRRLSEAINNCDQKLKDAQKAAESLKKCQETKEALETNEKILQDKLLQARNIHSAAEADGSVDQTVHKKFAGRAEDTGNAAGTGDTEHK